MELREDYLKSEELDVLDEEEEEGGHNTVIPCFIRDILVSRTSADETMTQQDIIRVLDKYPYAVSIERRALSRTLDDLMLVYSYIHRNTSGYYYSKSGDDF